MAGQAEGTEVVRAALGAANLASVMGSASPMLFQAMLAAAFDSRLFVERFDEADELFVTGWEIAERRGAVMTLTSLALIRAASNWWRGRFADAHKVLAELAGIQAAAGLREVQEHAAVILAMLAVEEGDVATALSEAGQAELLVSAQNPWGRTRLWRIYAELALDAGRASEAVRLAREMRDLHERLGILEPCWSPWADTAMVAFLRAGLLDEAQALVEHLDMVTERLPCRWPRSVAALGRAGLAEARGALEEAEQHHRQAVHLLDGVGLPLRRARALLIYGRFLRRNRQPVLRAGASVRGDRRERGLRRCSVRSASTNREGKWWATAPAKFQAIERSGAERDDSGHRGASNRKSLNRLFISVKTVEHHLTSAYSKLGIRSRKELQKPLQAP